MSPWDELIHQFELLTTALVAIILAFIGDLVRLFHIQEQGGEKVTFSHVPAAILRAALMGVIATTVASYLHDAWHFPEIAGGACGGILGYLGPTTIRFAFDKAIEIWSKK